MGRRATAAFEHAAAAALSLAVFALLTRVWRCDLRYPLDEVAGDGAQVCAAVAKGMVDCGWYVSNRFLSAPTGLDLHDYPAPDPLLLLWMKGLALLSRRPLLVLNLTYIAGYPVVASATLHALRRMGVRLPIAP